MWVLQLSNALESDAAQGLRVSDMNSELMHRQTLETLKQDCTYVARELALHEKTHGHVKSKDLSVHLELQVVLGRFPLETRTEVAREAKRDQYGGKPTTSQHTRSLDGP